MQLTGPAHSTRAVGAVFLVEVGPVGLTLLDQFYAMRKFVK